MIDIVIANVPGTVNNGPLMAPALLKSAVSKAGFTCKTIDFNGIFHASIDYNSEVEKYFLEPHIDVNHVAHDKAKKLIDQYAQQIVNNNPKFVGVSVFTYQSRVAGELLAIAIRKIKTDIKIIFGGQGVIDSGIMGNSSYAQRLISNNIIDYYIRSEGEISLVELLKGNINYPGINDITFSQIQDLDNLPWPDYSDYDFSIYRTKSIPILASRGCVRDCSFCDIHEHWKYAVRDGNDVADEMIYHAQTYGIYKFGFGDSLVNGSLKQFKKFIKKIAEFNQSSNNKITWTGQYIVRSSKQLNKEYWQNLAKSGATSLAIGVETGSDQVRKHMQKGFTNDDLDYTVQMFEQYNISCLFMIITGYPTETFRDFQETLDMFTKYQHLGKKGLISVGPGSGLAILPGTLLFKQADTYNIQLDKWENNWIAHDNPALDVDERINRRRVLIEHLRKLEYTIRDVSDEVFSMLEDKRDYLKKRQIIMKKITNKSK